MMRSNVIAPVKHRLSGGVDNFFRGISFSFKFFVYLCKNSHLFLLSLLIAHEMNVVSFVAPARKVRIRLRPITQYL